MRSSTVQSRVCSLNGLKALNGGKKEAGGASIKVSLLAWCTNIVNAGGGALAIRDFSESFLDGSIFCAIINKLCPGAIDMTTAKNGGTEALAAAFQVAEDQLGTQPSQVSDCSWSLASVS